MIQRLTSPPMWCEASDRHSNDISQPCRIGDLIPDVLARYQLGAESPVAETPVAEALVAEALVAELKCPPASETSASGPRPDVHHGSGIVPAPVGCRSMNIYNFDESSCGNSPAR